MFRIVPVPLQFYYQPVVIKVISIAPCTGIHILLHEPNMSVPVKMGLVGLMEGRGSVKFVQARTHIRPPEKSTCVLGSRSGAQLGFAIV